MPSAPSGTSSLPIRPSSTASNSIVALSVSISARMSPEWTSSPSFTSHLASLPSSIVGDSAGMRISIDMSGDDVPIEILRLGFRAFASELGRHVDNVPGLLVDCFEIVLARDAARDQLLPEVLDRIALLPHGLHFIARSVLRRVGHGVAAIAICLHLKDDWAFA